MKKRIVSIAALGLGYVGWRRRRASRARVEAPAVDHDAGSGRRRPGPRRSRPGRRGERRPLAVDFAPALATDWELLIDGPAFFPRMLADIDQARSDVHILIFGYRPGKIGTQFRDALVAKVSAGVPVRLIVDGIYTQPRLGSWDLYRELVAGGVEVVANQGMFLDLDGPIGHRRIDWRFDDFGHFDHRKVVVVDGRVAYVGGPGIEDHFADEQFHDVMLRVEGPIVAQLQAMYLLSWHMQGGALPATPEGLDRFFPASPQGDGVPMELLLNNPGEKHLPIATAFEEAIAGARRRLYVINPYLADHAIIRGIIAAAQRGVEVRVIVPAKPSPLPAVGAIRHWFAAFKEAGVDIREHPQFAHAKVVLSDDTVLIGTANLDALSLRRNWEVQLRCRDAGFADYVARELFDRDVALSSPARSRPAAGTGSSTPRCRGSRPCSEASRPALYGRPPEVATQDSRTRRWRSSSLTRSRFECSRSRTSSKLIPSVFIRYAAITVAERPLPFAQWMSTVRPSASWSPIHATASVRTASSGTVTSGTRNCRWVMPCES